MEPDVSYGRKSRRENEEKRLKKTHTAHIDVRLCKGRWLQLSSWY